MLAIRDGMNETLTADCLMHVLTHLTVRDKLKCRLVCKQWLTAVDKLFSGQQTLEIVAVNQSGCGSGSGECTATSITVDRRKLNFRIFHFMLMRFRNIQTLTIKNLMQLSDIVMFTVANQCDNLAHLHLCDENNEHSLFYGLSGYGWHLLTQAYPNLTSLTLRQCRLTEDELTKIIAACDQIKYLDISDNEVVGTSVSHLGAHIETLVCGDLSNEETIESILNNLCVGNGVNLKSLTIFGTLSSLSRLKEISNLTQLCLHFHTEEENIAYLADIGHLSLKVLALEQIRCYEQMSAVDEHQFVDMLKNSNQLQRLTINGDYEWDLRLSDNSMERLVKLCPTLEEFSLTGNGRISDRGISSLSVLPLRRLSLSSFHSITDSSIRKVLNKPSVKSLVLTDLSRITENLVLRAINVCEKHPKRSIDLTLSASQLNKKLIDRLTLPKNLKLKVDTQRSNKLSDEEPSTLQMMVVIAMSALILLMALLTTVVVVLVPLAMAIMMVHEYLLHSMVLDVPTLVQVKGSLDLDVNVIKQAYLKLLYSLV